MVVVVLCLVLSVLCLLVGGAAGVVRDPQRARCRGGLPGTVKDFAAILGSRGGAEMVVFVTVHAPKTKAGIYRCVCHVLAVESLLPRGRGGAGGGGYGTFVLIQSHLRAGC